MMRINDLHQVRAVTANYFFWQGLRLVPMGAALVLVAATLTPAVALPAGVRTSSALALLLLALWLSTSVLGGYYRRTFGDVQDDPGQHTRRSRIKWLVVYPAVMISMIVDMKLAPPIIVSGIV